MTAPIILPAMRPRVDPTQIEDSTDESRPRRGRPPKPWPAARPPVECADLLSPKAAPRAKHDFRTNDYRVWVIEPDWFLVELDPTGERLPTCCSVVIDVHGTLHCTCANGILRIGCPHVLAVGEK